MKQKIEHTGQEWMMLYLYLFYLFFVFLFILFRMRCAYDMHFVVEWTAAVRFLLFAFLFLQFCLLFPSYGCVFRQSRICNTSFIQYSNTHWLYSFMAFIYLILIFNLIRLKFTHFFLSVLFLKNKKMSCKTERVCRLWLEHV